MSMDNSAFEYDCNDYPFGGKERGQPALPRDSSGSGGMQVFPLAQGGKVYYSEHRVLEDVVVEPWSAAENDTDFLCIQVLLSGSVGLQTAVENRQQDSEHVLLFRSRNTGFRILLPRGQVVRCVGVVLPLESEVLQLGAVKELVGSLCERHREGLIATIALQRDTRRWALELFCHAAGTGLPAADLQREGLARCYLSSLLNDYAASQQSLSLPVSPLTTWETGQSEQICAYIESNLESVFSMPSLEERFGLSRYRLNELFRLSHGQTFSGYIRQQRLLKARQLIEREGVPVKAAALNVGYRYVSNFTRAYREYFGCTPGNSSPGTIEEY